MSNNIELSDRTMANAEEEDVKCIMEKNLNFTGLIMVKKHLFSSYTLNNCVTYCLKHWPDHAYVLISYEDDIFSPDEFKCMCAHKHAFDKNKRLPEFKCSNKCPESQDKYR